MLTVFRRQDEPESVVIPDPASIECDCSGDPLVTRQEEKDSADVNRVIARYMATGQLPSFRPAFSGDVDYDMDLQAAIAAVDSVKQAWISLAPAVRARYDSPEALLTAAAQLTLDLKEPEPQTRRVGDQPRDRRAADKTAATNAAAVAAAVAAVDKRSASGS